MDNMVLELLLDEVRQQNYPLSIGQDNAEALTECVRRIMALVPEDERVFVRADYDQVTSALFHPNPEPEGVL